MKLGYFGLSRRTFVALASTALAACALPSGAFAATYVAPEEPRQTGQYTKAAVHAAAEAVAYYLGLDNTTVRQSSFNPTAEDYATQNFFGLFGSSMNQNPDSYLWNYFYNFYAADNGLATAGDAEVPQLIAGGGPNGADDSGASIALRPDVLIGISANSTASSYAAQIAAVEENCDDDPDNDYDPFLIPWNASSYEIVLQNMHQIAEAAMQLDTPTRYDEEGSAPGSGALAAAEAYEAITLGTQYYVLQQIDEGNIGRAAYMYVSSVDTSTNTLVLGSNEVYSLESSDRLLAAVENVADNVIDKYPDLISTYTVVSDRDGSESQEAAVGAADIATIIEAEGDNLVIICIEEGLGSNGVEGSDLATVLGEAGLSSEQINDLRIFTSTGGFIHNQMTASEPNGPEYALYVPELTGYVYNEIIDQADLLGYYFYHLYHITESEVQSAIDQACENITTADGLTLSDGYEADIQAKLDAGKAYYAEHAADIINTYPKLASYEDALAAWAYELTTENTALVEETVSLSAKENGVLYPGDVAAQLTDGTALSETSSVNTKFFSAAGDRVYSITEPGSYILQVNALRGETSGNLADGTFRLGYVGTVELPFEVVA